MMFRMTEPNTRRTRCWNARWNPVHPARRPRTELRHERDARVGSSRSDPYRRWPARQPRLYGPLHGGANEEVLQDAGRDRLRKRNVPEYIKRVKAGEGKLMGFGHRVYKNYDPRARIIKQGGGRSVRGDRQESHAGHRAGTRAHRAGRRVLVKRKLYPNVDFYSGIIYQAMGFPVNVPGAVRDPAHGGLARAVARDVNDPEQKIARPRQIYTGQPRREMTMRNVARR